MSIRDMVTRHSDYNETQDMIPTPPYAMRALYEYVAPELKDRAPELTAWEPAAGFCHLSSVMEEYGHKSVLSTDKNVQDRTFRGLKVSQQDFLAFTGTSADFIATNPPYKYAEQFVKLSLDRANCYVAMLVRVQALEGQTRYRRLYNNLKPTKVALFSDRIPFKTGEVVRKASKMFFHVWVFWDKSKMRGSNHDCELMWIRPDAQKQLEKDSDYESF